MQPCTKMIQVLIKYLFYYKSHHHIELKLGLNWSFLLNSWIGLMVKMAFQDAPLHATFKISDLIKGTSNRKLFFCHMIALNVSWMDFIWQKTKTLFSRYLIFALLMNPQMSKICDVILDITVYQQWYCFDCFFRILGNIKMKFGQIIVQITANIFSLSFAQLGRLETSFIFFCDFEKIKI